MIERRWLADAFHAFSALAGLTLAIVDDETVSVHRLLQMVVRNHDSVRDDRTAVTRALAALDDAFPPAVESGALAALRAARARLD